MKQFYTYIHYKPDGVPFYVGKGCDRRAYDFRFTVRKNKWHDRVVRKFGFNRYKQLPWPPVGVLPE